ncbi:MAG: hypothetical protein MJ102_05335 [Clostridia bacterium]|nr:hypothetical protein [Clostridia bacterium]
MKRITQRILTLALACVMLVGTLSSCANLGKTAMELGDAKITGNMIEFWLSRYKATFLEYYSSSIKAQYGLTSTDDIWRITDSDSKKTYDQLFTDYIVDNAKTYLCSLYLFDKFKLKLSDKDVKEVDEYIDELIEAYGGGDKSELNFMLAKYGANTDILREVLLIEEKVSVLQDYLYGADGVEKIGAAEVEAYYQKNYVRMKQISIFVNQRPATDEKGNYLTDDDGYVKYEEMSTADNEIARSKADEALAKIRTGTAFETVELEYDENKADDMYINGIYMSAESAYGNDADLQKIYETLLEMSVGEVRMVELTHNLTIVQKLELDEGAYDKSINSDFFVFTDAQGNQQSFAEYLVTPMFLNYVADKLAEYKDDIKYKDDIISKYKISEVEPNYYF